jgi:hypothetical protein
LEVIVKKAGFILPFLAMLPLSGQSWEVGAFVGQQTLNSGTLTYSGGTTSFDPDKKTVYGVRLGRSLVDLGPMLVQLTLGGQGAAKTPVKQTDTAPEVTVIPNGQARMLSLPTGAATAVTVSGGELKTSHVSVGAMVNFKAFWAVGAGIEYRFEKIDSGVSSVNYARPWARVNAGISIPAPFLKPFVGVEADFPLASKKIEDAGSNEDILKALAPKGQVGIYAGIRF